MPSSEVKHRKGKNSGETNGTPKPSCREEGKKDGAGLSEQNSQTAGKSRLCSSSLDMKTAVSLLCLSACFVLSWVVFQQNARVNEVEEKYRLFNEKAANLLVLEERMGAVSKKLEASEDHLKGERSSAALVTRLEHDITSLNAFVMEMQEDQDASSRRLQGVNERFLNVTEAWQSGLGTVTEELANLRSESRSVHGRVTERVNDAESRLRALTERLEELEDGTRRNARLLERTEEEDAQRVQSHLDWNTRQVTKLQEQLKQLSRNDIELKEKLEETEPRAKECETQLPTVEDAVRSILRLRADLSSAERRLEELTLQVLGTEDSMLKALAEIVDLRQALDDLQMDSSVMKVSNELDVVLEAMKELEHLQRIQDLDSGREELQADEGKDFEKIDFQNCDDVQMFLESQEVKSPLSHLNRVEQEVSQLREWSSSLAERRQQMQEKLATLLQAVEQIENRTTTIYSDITSKVATVRTDVRRMGGLEFEVGALLTQTGQLEEKVAQVEKHMVKRVGEVLAASIDRISGLKSSMEKNSQNLEQIRKHIPELSAADKKLSDRILALESSRAKLVRTVTFASDLRPKVFTIKRDFASLDPQMADLTLRIGHLAQDVMKREEEIAEIKESLANFVTVRGDLNEAQEELAVKPASTYLIPVLSTLSDTEDP
ncbi:hypothetical protein NFI96_014614 [Prochilodus magdalenae]|nr:hypothetical protein NFI96_014614 [Prochilodus magdalenae]